MKCETIICAATQQQIVAEIEAEQALVAANRELISRFEQKIQATLARVWGEDTALAANHIPDAASSQAKVRVIPQRLKAISTSK